jgi:hypothetical protein
MILFFGFKNISSNDKKRLISILICFYFFVCFGQNQKKQVQEDKKEQLEMEQEKALETKRAAFLAHQLTIQSKATQKRMKANFKMTDRYYKRKMGQTLFQKLFVKKRKRQK